jgi:hypothetical protein
MISMLKVNCTAQKEVVLKQGAQVMAGVCEPQFIRYC